MREFSRNFDAKYERYHRVCAKQKEVLELRLSDSMRLALETLYSGSHDPLCVADENYHILWAPDSRAQQLLPSFCAAIQTSGVYSLPIQGKEYSFPVGCEAATCRAEILDDCGKTIYLLRFSYGENLLDRSVKSQPLLSVCAEEIRTALAVMVQAIAVLYEQLGVAKAESAAYDSVDMLLAPCYELLNLSLRCSELVWYETVDSGEAEYAPVDVGQILLAYTESLRRITKGILTIETNDFSLGLTAALLPERLEFALLVMFLLVQGGRSTHTLLRIIAERNEDDIIITMCAVETGDHAERLHPPLPHLDDGTALAAEALLERFCHTFRCRLLKMQKKEDDTIILRIPYAASSVPVTFRKGDQSNTDHRFSDARAMLSSILTIRYGNS